MKVISYLIFIVFAIGSIFFDSTLIAKNYINNKIYSKNNFITLQYDTILKKNFLKKKQIEIGVGLDPLILMYMRFNPQDIFTILDYFIEIRKNINTNNKLRVITIINYPSKSNSILIPGFLIGIDHQFFLNSYFKVGTGIGFAAKQYYNSSNGDYKTVNTGMAILLNSSISITQKITFLAEIAPSYGFEIFKYNNTVYKYKNFDFFKFLGLTLFYYL